MNNILRSTAALALLLCCGVASFAQEAAFKRAAKLPDVEYVYLSKDMLSMGGGSLPVAGMDEAAARLTSMEVLSTSSQESASKALPMLDDTRTGMDLLGHISENDGTVDIYGVRSGDHLSELLVLVVDEADMCAVMMKGNIDPDVIKSIAKESRNNKKNKD